MVCWSENLDWKKILKKVGVPVGEEEKSKAIYDLEDEMGHDYLKSLPEEERERLLIEKLMQMKGTKTKSKKQGKKDDQKKYVEEEQSMYM